jgi:hypothetical protein
LKKPTAPPNIQTGPQPAKCCSQCCKLHHAIYDGHKSHQRFFSTVEEQLAADILVPVMDSFVAAGNAKKTNATQ